MRSLWKDVLLGFAIGFVLPGILVNYTVGVVELSSEQNYLIVDSKETQELDATLELSPNVPISVLVRTGQGEVRNYDMDAYLQCVLLAEMPSYFEMDALKAQAIVARTYALKAQHTGGKHGDGSVCIDSSCCQGYILPETYIQNGGTKESTEKIRRAVEDTSGHVLCYEGELIEATYFSCSGGRTEDAAAVWGTDFPYLRAVDSPGEESAAHYQDTAIFTKESFASALDVSLETYGDNWIGAASYTSGGGIGEITIGGKRFTGTQLRKLLNLRSTDITIQPSDKQIQITTMGFGHRVGMSQYGADAMAASGADFREILSYYYRGTELVQWRE